MTPADLARSVRLAVARLAALVRPGPSLAGESRASRRGVRPSAAAAVTSLASVCFASLRSPVLARPVMRITGRVPGAGYGAALRVYITLALCKIPAAGPGA